MRVVVDDDDAVKFAERLLRFWRTNLLLDARLLTRRLCGQFRVFVWTRRVSNKIWREILEFSEIYFTTLHSKSVERISFIVFTKSRVIFMASQLSFFDVLARRLFRCVAVSS